MGDLTKNFSRSEFVCKCGCGKDNIDLELVRKLQVARSWLAKPMRINSGVRCEAHNEAVGGKPDSSHLKGLAADIQIPTNSTRFWLFAALWKAVFFRFGHGDGFIHVDIDPDKPAHSMWLYN